ncbi:MAG: NADH-quinone oxidoreductase subunit NuoK [Thermodesulfobacteriota bacterium]
MTLENSIILSFILFSIGVYGMLTRRQLIGLLLSIEIILNGANINFIAFAHFRAVDPTAGAIFPIFVMAISAAEMAVALAIVIAMHRQTNNKLDIQQLRRLNG